MNSNRMFIEHNAIKKEVRMDGLKILEVVGIYSELFKSKGIEPADYPHGLMLDSPHSVLAHCAGMLGKIREFVKEGRIEKAFRWLGFMQGCLWVTGYYSLEDLMNHNRPAKE